MRKIKFRAWHKDAAEYCRGSDCKGSVSCMFRWVDDGQPVILEQFTGLKDINGFEIYEGDIIKSDFYGDDVDWIDIASVSYDSKKAAFVFDSLNGEQDAFIYGAENGCLEVIGNIHQNTELLNEK